MPASVWVLPSLALAVALLMVSSISLATSLINARNSARLESKCWYNTGLVTPAASAMSFIDVR